MAIPIDRISDDIVREATQKIGTVTYVINGLVVTVVMSVALTMSDDDLLALLEGQALRQAARMQAAPTPLSSEPEA